MKRTLHFGLYFCLLLLCSCSPDYEVIFIASNQLDDTISLSYTQEAGNLVTVQIPPGNNYEILRKKLPGYGASFANDKSFTISAVECNIGTSPKNMNEKAEWIQEPTTSDTDVFYLYLSQEDF